MQLLSRWRQPRISVVVVFHNMRREAPRTLHALTTAYQRGVRVSDYEVLVLDSNSDEPLDGAWVESLQDNFRYLPIQSDAPTPNKAMNAGLHAARAPLVACMIDGARIPTPGMLGWMLQAHAQFGPAYVMTLGLHLGPKPQQYSVSEGYCQAVEDELLAGLNWQVDGYRLFSAASLAGSSARGFFGRISESNCFCCPTGTLRSLGGFDERFVAPGGGLINLHVHNQLVMHPELTPVMLLGEASFHQFHGGVSTNVPRSRSPWAGFQKEYEAVTGQAFVEQWRAPQFLGHMPEAAQAFIQPDLPG